MNWVKVYFSTVEKAKFLLARVVTGWLFIWVFTGAQVADTFTYNLSGSVIDASGTNVGGAKVAATVNNQELGSTISKDDGSFELKFSTVKEYTGKDMLFIVTREGFQKKVVPNIPIFAGEPLVLNFKITRDLKSMKIDKEAELYRTSEFLQQIEAERW
jgi:hypothetical protein